MLQTKPHDVFHRDGCNLYMTHTVSLTEALCGFEMVLKHLDGRDIVVKEVPGMVIKPRSIKGLRGEGMPMYRNPMEKGNLYIKFDVEFPENHFAGEAALKEIEALLGDRPSTGMDGVPVGDHVEEVDLHDYDPTSQSQRQEAYHEDEQQPRGSVECAHQ